jgi:hypothetical protein
MRQRRQFLQGLAALSLAGAATQVGALPPAGAEAGTGTLLRRLRFGLTFTNPMNSALQDQRFWCYLPATVMPGQRLQSVQVSTAHQVQDDALGHNILALAFDHFPPLAQKVVSVTLEVALHAELNTAAQPQLLANPQIWLTVERFIESDDPRIRALAAGLHRATALDSTRVIYDWVQANMAYAGYIADDLGALQGLLTRRGDCTEYADLVVALARANSIPARMIGGYVTDRDSALRPQDYHNWAEVYLDGAWRVVDAQKGNWLAPPQQYVAFRIYRDAAVNAVGLAHRYRVQGDLKVTF